ncbi:MAG: hypothetical protein V1742_08885 [Pseudomonadota bacterium]
MHKKMMVGLVLLVALILSVGCSCAITTPKTMFDYCPPEYQYVVAGQVRNSAHQAIEGVKVVLIKRTADLAEGEAAKPVAGGTEMTKKGLQGQFLVALSARSGDYSFEFEPWGAYDVWLYFEALDQGYQPQMIQLNPYLRSYVGRGIGLSPVYLNVILEPIIDLKTRQIISPSK